MRVVIGVAGGIAAYKVCHLVRMFAEAGHDVTVVPTAAALRFVGTATWEALSGNPVRTDVFEDVPQVRHVRLGREADLVVVAPATADLLARAAAGLADDLLTATLLTTTAPVVMAPAMHTEMWQHPATVANVATLRSRGVHVIEPAVGRLTGADSGPGRLPEPDVIHDVCRTLMAPGDLAGRRIVVSAGGTREPIDPVRFLGNRSSGKQGYAIASAAAARGAAVTLVSANVALPVPDGVDLVRVGTALELREAMALAYPEADAIVMAAAVADFRPEKFEAAKIKKTHGPADESAPVITLVRNPDILAELVARRAAGGTGGGPLIVGFAAETGDADGSVLDHARAKLERKGCDVIVANEVGVDVTFGKDTTTVHVLIRGNDDVRTVGPATKEAVADTLLDVVGELLAETTN